MARVVKVIAKAKKPRIATDSSANDFGTSSDTTRSVKANAKTQSQKHSKRETEVPRCRKPSTTSGAPVAIACRIIASDGTGDGGGRLRAGWRSQVLGLRFEVLGFRF